MQHVGDLPCTLQGCCGTVYSISCWAAHILVVLRHVRRAKVLQLVPRRLAAPRLLQPRAHPHVSACTWSEANTHADRATSSGLIRLTGGIDQKSSSKQLPTVVAPAAGRRTRSRRPAPGAGRAAPLQRAAPAPPPAQRPGLAPAPAVSRSGSPPPRRPPPAANRQKRCCAGPWCHAEAVWLQVCHAARLRCKCLHASNHQLRTCACQAAALRVGGFWWMPGSMPSRHSASARAAVRLDWNAAWKGSGCASPSESHSLSLQRCEVVIYHWKAMTALVRVPMHSRCWVDAHVAGRRVPGCCPSSGASPCSCWCRCSSGRKNWS